MPEDIQFQPLDLAQTLQDQQNLEALCSPCTMPPWEIYTPNDHYGYATIIKAYSGYPFERPLPVLLTHGIYFDDVRVYEMEEKCELSGVMTYPNFRTRVWRAQSNKRIVPAASPLLYAQQLMRQCYPSADTVARTKALYFLPHSTAYINIELDIQRLVAALQQQTARLPQIDQVQVCIHWQDIAFGKHKPFVDAGFEVVSAGNINDPDFIFRLWHLLSRCRLALGAFPGGHVLATVTAGVPFFAWQPVTPISKINPNFRGVLGNFRSRTLSAQMHRWGSVFAKDPTAPTNDWQSIVVEQQRIVDDLLGRQELLSPLELYAQLQSFAYAKEPTERTALEASIEHRYAQDASACNGRLFLGEGLAAANDWAGAVALAEQDRAAGRLSAAGKLRLAAWQHQLAHCAEAEALIAEAYAADAAQYDGWAQLAQSAVQRQDWATAQQWLDRDAASERLSAAYWVDYANTLAHLDDIEQAHHWLVRAYNDNHCADEALVKLWQKAMKTRNCEAALALAQRDVDAGRLSQDWLWNAAELYDRCGQNATAVALIESGYAKDPHLKDQGAQLGWYVKGEQQADWAAAHEWMLHDLTRERLSSQWKIYFACVKAALNHWDEALALVKTAYAEAPHVIIGYTLLGWSGYFLGRGAAFYREYYERDLALNRQYPNDVYWQMLGAAEGVVHQWDDYCTYYRRYPVYDWTTQIGVIHCQEGRVELAAQLLGLEYDHHTMSAHWWPTYAWMLRTLGQNDTADMVLQRITASRHASEEVWIGNYVNPKARMTVAQLRDYIEGT